MLFNIEYKMFKGNIETLTIRNKNYRKVLYTDKYSQLALMTLMPGEDIPEETHDGSQFIRVERGRGVCIRGGERILLKDGVAVEFAPGVHHYIKQTGKFRCIYIQNTVLPNIPLIWYKKDNSPLRKASQS